MLALVGVILAPVLGLERTLVFRDALPYQAAQNEILGEALAEGRLAEWDPSNYCGVPYLASPPAQALYPPRLAAVRATRSLTQPTDLGAVFHLLLLAGGAWVLGRQLGLRFVARATLAAVALLAGPTFSVLENQPSLAGIAWLPWGMAAALWARRGRAEEPRAGVTLAPTEEAPPGSGGGEAPSGEAGAEERRAEEAPSVSGVGAGLTPARGYPVGALRFAAVGLVLAAPVYAGAVQEALWSAVLVAAVLAHGQSRRRAGVAIGLSAVWSVALGAAILIPALLLAPHTTRLALGVDEVGAFSFHPLRIVELVLPFPWGLPFPERDAYLGRAFEPAAGELWAQSAHVGIAALLLALRAFTAGVPVRLRPARRLFAWTGGLGLALACGRHLPGFALLAASPYGVFRFPEKHLTLVALAAAGLAALAIHADRPRTGRDAWLAGGALLAVWGVALLAWLLGPGLAESAGKQAPGFAGGQALGVSLVVAAWWGALCPRRSGSRRRWASCALCVLAALPVARRLVFAGPVDLLHYGGVVADRLHMKGMEDGSGFPPRIYVEPAPFGRPPSALSDGEAIPAMQLLTLRGASAGLYGLSGVQGMTGWWPRNRGLLLGTPASRAAAATGWWLGPTEAVGDGVPERHDLGRGVTLVRLPAAPRLEVQGTRGGVGTVLRPQPERLLVRVDAEGPGTLVWRESAYPGWTVRVGDQPPVPAERAGPFLSTPIPAGSSEFEFRYRTPGLTTGRLVVLGAVLLWIVALIRVHKARQRARDPDPQP